MVGTNFSEIDCNLFDNINDLYEYDNIFNYPINVDASSLQFSVENWYSLTNIWPNEYDSVISGNTPDLYLPSNDILPLEWLSNKVDDSFCEESLIENKLEQQPTSSVNKEDFVLLESSSSHTGGKTTVRRTRSKRPRPATFNPSRSIMQLISTTSSFVGENMQTSVISTKAVSSENFLEYQITKEKPNISSVESKKKKKTKAPLPAAPGDEHALVPIKKCTHCEMTKTPQWRAGPKGPKTLCNACGVRFKSGRLCAEYRPAASPTFCPYLHSNSHKKILEMRRRNKNSGILALEYI